MTVEAKIVPTTPGLRTYKKNWKVLYIPLQGNVALRFMHISIDKKVLKAKHLYLLVILHT